EVTCLALCDGDIGRRRDGFLETLLAIDGRAGTNSALKFYDITGFGTDSVDQPLASHATFENQVRHHSREVEIFRCVNAAVEQHNGNLGFLGFSQHVIPTGSDNWGNKDSVHALGNEAANGLDLV